MKLTLYQIFCFTFIFLCLNPVNSQSESQFRLEKISAARLKTDKTKLANHIILDARSEKEFKKEHIEGSLPFNWEKHTFTDEQKVRYRMLPESELIKRLNKMGIEPTYTITVYGDAETSWGGEGWVCWLLAYLGHKGPVRIVDGGINAWKKAGFDTVSTPPGSGRDHGERAYNVSTQKEINITATELKANLNKFFLVDTRSTLEWFKGHIPGAVHIPWEKFYIGTEKKLLSKNDLIKLLKENGYKGEKKVVYYCTGGVRSAFAWMVHELSGIGSAINFEGGTEEWEIIK